MQDSAPSLGFVLKITVFGFGRHAHSVSLPFWRRWRHPSGGVVHHGALCAPKVRPGFSFVEGTVRPPRAVDLNLGHNRERRSVVDNKGCASRGTPVVAGVGPRSPIEQSRPRGTCERGSEPGESWGPMTTGLVGVGPARLVEPRYSLCRRDSSSSTGGVPSPRY
jgi:hypothetical protein